ncbi:hypothetical protein, partial [Methylosinus sp. KRF6]|uniref:hypothetical protein n=1 Tax=Methylosinus sp. KRF6 TaxID=2846853 RepID=UPI00209B1027
MIELGDLLMERVEMANESFAKIDNDAVQIRIRFSHLFDQPTDVLRSLRNDYAVFCQVLSICLSRRDSPIQRFQLN